MLNGASFEVAELRPTPLGRPHPATRLAGLGLGLATALLAPPAALAVLLVLVVAALNWTGLGWLRQLAALRAWLAVAALVLVVHTLTTVQAAPLGHPSWRGLLAGVFALGRVAATVGLLGLYLRIASLDDLIAGIGWWLAPLRRLGVPVDDLGLALAVALGTAPVVLGEGRRIALVTRLRRTGPAAAAAVRGARLRQWRAGVVDRARLVVPVMETLARRAEALNLSLRRRRPGPVSLGPLPLPEGVVLAGWLALLVWSPW